MTSLQFITHRNENYSYYEGAKLALEGGCRWIQLRMKDTSYEEFKYMAIKVKKLCEFYNATFIIDDKVELVKEIKADGVHLGLKDMPISQARKILGKNFIIGGTANKYSDIEKHWKDGANYIGCGPFRYTSTKKKLAPTLGLEGYSEILKKMDLNKCHLPLVAIGGITINDIPDLKSIGIKNIAISSGILNTKDPQKETKTFINILA